MAKTLVRTPAATAALPPAQTSAPRPWSVANSTLAWGAAVAVALVHLAGAAHNPTPLADEGTYAAQAWAVLHLDRLAPYTYWYDHPPLAWILLAGMWWLLGPLLPHGLDAVAQLRFAMWLWSLVALGALVGTAKRLRWHPGAAATAVILWGLSPLAITLERIVELDNVAMALVLVAIWALSDPRRRLHSVVVAGLAFGAAILSVETALLWTPAVLWLLVQRYGDERRPLALWTFLLVTGSIGSLYLLYATLKGELLPGPGHVSLLGSAAWQLFERAGSGFILRRGSGASMLLDGWLHLDPVLVLLVPGACVGLVSRRARPFAIAALVYTAMALRPGYLPATYPVEAFPAVALVGGGLVDAVVSRSGAWRRPHRDAIAALLAALALLGGLAWTARDAQTLFAPEDQAQLAAEAWLRAHGDRTAPILVADTMWVDVVGMGWHPYQAVVWYWKITTDPAVERRYPRGWRAMDLIVVTPQMRAVQAQLPFIRAVQQSGHLVAQFGTGGSRIDIYRP